MLVPLRENYRKPYLNIWIGYSLFKNYEKYIIQYTLPYSI